MGRTWAVGGSIIVIMQKIKIIIVMIKEKLDVIMTLILMESVNKILNC